jgi:hypothetical protein
MSFPYTITVRDRDYSAWELSEIESGVSVDPSPKLNPRQQKLFSQDVVARDGDLIYSFVRKETHAGILILSTNMTYGRTENKKRLLYKCIPNNRELPEFLVAYDLKMGFSKDIKNKYVLFQFEHWNDEMYPRGTLTETLGDVDDLAAFYEYQLYIRDIHSSISQISKRAHQIFSKISEPEMIEQIMSNPTYHIEKRLDAPIYTIDPAGSMDLDDAWGIRENGDDFIVSIYIANVFVWLDTFGLWGCFGDRISTIYLPDKRRSMLPTILSEQFCSLLASSPHFAFCMDTVIDRNTGTIRSVSFANVLINVRRNYVYEEPRLLANRDYQRMMEVSRRLSPDISDSHDLVEFWMIRMNAAAGDFLRGRETGIFRVCDGIPNPKLPKQIGFAAGQYVAYGSNTDLRHNLLDVGAYAQISSPIRRLVDIVNMILFFNELWSVSSEALDFANMWVGKMRKINQMTKSIRRAQTDCHLMFQLSTTDIGSRIMDGILFSPCDQDDGITKYSVYLEELRLVSSVRTREELEEGQQVKCRVFVFNDDATLGRKVRIQLV